jgi:hypothetical protein
MRHHRTHLGDRFSEGARLLWIARGATPLAEFERSLEWPRGQLSNLLYGERGAGRKTATMLLQRFGIPLEAWDLPSSVEFVPPAAREDEAEEGAA